jgi:hypothetical protein
MVESPKPGERPLRSRPSWRKQRAEEKVVRWILNPIAVFVDPPATTKIPGLPGTELGLPVLQTLKWPRHREGIFHDKRVVIKALAGHIHNTRCSVAEP